MKIDDRKLYCYLQGASLASLLGEADLIDGLLKELRINAHGRRSHLVSLEDKLDAVSEQLRHLSTAKALGFAGVDVAEILAVHIWRGCRDSRNGKRLFHAEKDEADLKPPVMKWLASNGYETLTEIPTSVSRADVIGVQLKTGLMAKLSFLVGGGDRALLDVAAVELKNDYAQWAKAEKQMSDYREYAKYVYFACTPAFAADYLDRVSRARKRWIPDALNDKLRKQGYGFLLVRGTEVDEIIPARAGDPRGTAEFINTLDGLAARANKKTR